MKIYRIKMARYGYIRFMLPKIPFWKDDVLIWMGTYTVPTYDCYEFKSRNNAEFWSKRVAAVYSGRLTRPIKVSVETGISRDC